MKGKCEYMVTSETEAPGLHLRRVGYKKQPIMSLWVTHSHKECYPTWQLGQRFLRPSVEHPFKLRRFLPTETMIINLCFVSQKDCSNFLKKQIQNVQNFKG